MISFLIEDQQELYVSKTIFTEDMFW